MGNVFWAIILVWEVIMFSEIATKEVSVKSGDMTEWFKESDTLRPGPGVLWTNPKSDGTTYTETCGRNTDFFFVTRHVDLRKAFADVFLVDMDAELNLCEDGIRDCNATYFEVYVYHGKKPPQGINDIKSFSKSNFTRIYNITLDKTVNTTSHRRIYEFKLDKNGSQGVTFGIRSRKACGKIYSMALRYFYCEEKFVNRVYFPNTTSPANGVKEVTSNCSELFSPSNHAATLTGYCRSNGTWDINNRTKCLCEKGYEPSSSRGCSKCRTNYFKPYPSNKKCGECPRNSNSNTERTSCQCKNGFYRERGNDFDPTKSPCHSLVQVKLNITVDVISEGTLNLTWKEMKQSGGPKEGLTYEVECYSCIEKKPFVCNMTCMNMKYNPDGSNLNQTFVKVSKLRPETYYIFKVYPKTSLNKQAKKSEWNFTETQPFRPKLEVEKGMQTDERKEQHNYFIMAGVGCALLLVVVCLLIVFIFRRKFYYKQELIIGNPNQVVELPTVGHKLYIDPTNYDSPEDALNDFASELNPSSIYMEMLIGGGEFGDVYKGCMKCSRQRTAIPVAVKTLKHDANAKSEKDFLLEASVMGQFDDPNVIRLEGVVTKSTPRMIVIEYMSNGSLDHFLMNNDGNLSQLQLVNMAKGVASGMKYLSAMHFVHRDLAARNILVNDELLCKISDFGLSRALETEGSSSGEYSTSGGKIPVRWTAPEAIQYRKFSSASDVWSFGILLWEIMSFAQRPYWEWDNFKVMRLVDEGFRLPAPKNCPKAVHELMLRCWSAIRSDRPKFEEITMIVGQWIRSPEILQEQADSSLYLGDWLQSIKMGNYVSVFIAAGFYTPHQLSGLGDQDLIRMGIRLIGHRNKILKGVRALEDLKNGGGPIRRVTSMVV